LQTSLTDKTDFFHLCRRRHIVVFLVNFFPYN
jgi:hypothetical protein